MTSLNLLKELLEALDYRVPGLGEEHWLVKCDICQRAPATQYLVVTDPEAESTTMCDVCTARTLQEGDELRGGPSKEGLMFRPIPLVKVLTRIRSYVSAAAEGPPSPHEARVLLDPSLMPPSAEKQVRMLLWLGRRLLVQLEKKNG